MASRRECKGDERRDGHESDVRAVRDAEPRAPLISGLELESERGDKQGEADGELTRLEPPHSRNEHHPTSAMMRTAATDPSRPRPFDETHRPETPSALKLAECS